MSLRARLLLRMQRELLSSRSAVAITIADESTATLLHMHHILGKVHSNLDV